MRPHLKNQSLFGLFEQQSRKTIEGCQALLDMIEEPQSLDAQAQRVSQIEHECDEITHAVVHWLHRTLITPLDRAAIHTLITCMDDVMDLVEATADRMALYQLAATTSDAVEMSRCLLATAEHVLGAVNGLRELRKPDAILAHCAAIARHETVADQLLRAALARLLREEKAPLRVLQWKEIYETLEAATDRCEDVANVIEGVVLENS
jgi:predicted phosphate transport protein (TIGR00153 family)